jgi:hypothetical protein
VRSERLGQTQLVALVSNITSSADINEQFLLPSTFGDCLINECSVQLTSIQTAVANSELRGPFWFLTSTSTVEAWQTARWTKDFTGTAIVSWIQLMSPILWNQTEILSVVAPFEDTGAGNQADVTVLIKTTRLRNQAGVLPMAAFDPAMNISPTR